MNTILMENTQLVMCLKPSRVFVRHGVSSKMSFRSARSPFPDPVGLWLTNLLVIRFTHTREESPGKTATVPQVNVRTAAKGPPTWRERLTEIISSFLHCWDRSRMPLTKSLLALTYAFPASSIPLHSFTSCRGRGTNISTVDQQQRHSHSTGYINCNQGADTMRTWGCFSAKIITVLSYEKMWITGFVWNVLGIFQKKQQHHVVTF